MNDIKVKPITDVHALDSAMAARSAGMRFSSPALDAAYGSGLAFLEGQLEKFDPKLYEPLKSITWPRDIVAKTGGGWVEYTSAINVNYGISGPNQNGIIGGATNGLPVVQADLSKDIYKVFSWGNAMEIPFVDQAKFQRMASTKSLDQILNDGLKLNHDKTVDQNVYTGFTEYGTTGLINDANVTAASVAAGASTYTAWSKKTPDEILVDVNAAITAGWAAGEYDVTAIANHILIPPSQYAYITTTKVSSAGNISILEYLLKNNIAKNQGVELTIAPSRWCIAAGTAQKDRMVSYVNDENKVYFDIPVPLSRIMTAPDPRNGSYVTLYAAQFGVVNFRYLQPVRYYDGI